MIQLEYSAHFRSMILANRYLKGIGWAKTAIFSPNSVSLFSQQPAITAPCLSSFVFSDLCPATSLSNWPLKSAENGDLKDGDVPD